MKKFLALGIGCLLAQGAFAQETTTPVPAPVAKPLPSIPANCEDQISDNGMYCSSKIISGSKITVTFAAVVNKDAPEVHYSPAFNTVDDLLSHYQDFDRWPEFASLSNKTVIEFVTSKDKNSVLFTTPSKNLGTGPAIGGLIPLRHAYSYKLKVQGIPLLKQSVTGLTYNYVVEPYEGAVGSLEFVAITTAPSDINVEVSGVKSQIGSIHIKDCKDAPLSYCDENKFLLIYETTIEPSVTFAMEIAANTVTAGIEDLLQGMLAQQEVKVPAADPVPVEGAPAADPVVTPVEEAPAADPVVAPVDALATTTAAH